MFSLAHIVVLLWTVWSIPLFCRAFVQYTEKVQQLYFLGFAGLCLCFDPLYWVWEWQNFGRLHWATTLPCYLCSLFWILLPLAVLGKGTVQQIAKSHICTLSFLCGVLGLVFNVYLNQYPFFSFVPLRSLLYHYLMILVASLFWASRRYRPQKGDALRSILPVLLLLGIAQGLHLRYGWDYCYTAGGLGTPLALLSARVPVGVFLCLLYGTMLLLLGLFYALYFGQKKSGASQKNAPQRVL